MGEKIYNRALEYLISEEYILNEDKDLYLYALKVLTRSLTNVLAVIAIGLFFDRLLESVSMFISFFVLRKFAGGLHSEKYIICFVSSILICSAGLILIKNAWYMSRYAYIVVMIISSILIVLFSPVEHPNKTISSKEAKVYKTIASVLSIVICALSTALILLNFFSMLGYSFGTGLIISSVLMAIGKIKYSYFHLPQIDELAKGEM